MTNQRLESQLIFSKDAITNAQNITAIKDALALYGYDDARLQEGAALQQAAEDAHNTQRTEYAEQYAATDAAESARLETNGQYMVHLRLARIAFANNTQARVSLLLDGRRKQSYTGWLDQAKTFYNSALNNTDIQAGLATFGIDQAALQAAQAKVLDVESKRQAQLKEMGEAQDATKTRDVAFEELQNWMSAFIEVARIALMDKPQYLESLGIVEPS